MSKILETYTFSGFGFDILLKNVIVKTAHGEEYPDINMNELKLITTKALLIRPVRLTGYQLKFIRSVLKLSFDVLSDKTNVAASTLRSWEGKGDEVTGFSIDQEKVFRLMAINTLLERERSQFDKELLLTKIFIEPKTANDTLDIDANTDYSFASNG